VRRHSLSWCRAQARRWDADALLAWANARLGRMQRLSGLRAIDALPRSPIGKVLKRDLRDRL
jgi:acyl-CoA synthetase (AMP-forming)/AMP-acid ligase II